VGEVAPAAGGAAGLPGRAGVRQLRVRADAGRAGGGQRLRVREPVPRPVGAPLRPDAVGELLAAASRRAGLDTAIRPHQLRHAFASNVADSGGGIDVVADLLGHASITSSQVYSHPDPSRLRAAVDAVPSPREQAGAAR
jgi:integrase